jgi:hypothetical protein
MKQIIQMFRIDVRMHMKSFMGAYIATVPLVILFVLRIFLPTVETTSATVAVVTEGPHAVEEAMIAELEEFATVIPYPTIDAMKQKLRGTGSAEGLYRDPEAGQYVSVLEENLEGNTIFSVGARVIRSASYRQEYPDGRRLIDFTATVPAELADRTENSPVATMGGAIFVVFLTIIAAFLIGLGIVSDKEQGTDRAIRVSPATTTEYYIGKSIFPLLVMVVYPFVAAVVLGLLEANLFQMYVGVILSFAVSLFVGLLMGALGRNQNEAIGTAKSIAMVLMLAILGGALLPDSWQWVVYWVPVYWYYDMVEEVFTLQASWTSVAWKSAVMVGITGIYFLAMRRRFAKGLS